MGPSGPVAVAVLLVSPNHWSLRRCRSEQNFE